jgi:hypothetical protein
MVMLMIFLNRFRVNKVWPSNFVGLQFHRLVMVSNWKTEKNRGRSKDQNYLFYFDLPFTHIYMISHYVI